MKYSKLILFILIALIITDSITYISWAGALNGDFYTYIATFLNYISIAILIRIAYTDGFRNNDIPKTIIYIFNLWLIWNIFSLIRGAFFANDYWDWKVLLLSSVSFSLISLAFFLGKNLNFAKPIFKFVLEKLFLLGFLFIPLTLVTNSELYSRLMIPLSLFILFFPYLKLNWKFLIIIVSTTSILMVIDFRSNIIKISFSVILLLLTFYCRKYISQSWLRFTHIILFILPLIFLTLAITDKYNIFEEMSKGEALTTVDKLGNEEDLKADTRTGLYEEVIYSLNYSGNMLFGEGASGKYQSEVFDELGDGRGRYGCEVGILNILLYDGIIGAIIYLLLLFNVSYLAICQSNNTLAKMLGLFIAFRWLFSFIEEFTQYDLNFFFFWIAMGLVSSNRFRKMTDLEIKTYFKLI